MNLVDTELLGDPIFQLNIVLWLAQPLPAGSPIIPIFYQSGFSIYAVAPLLGLSPDLRLDCQRANFEIQDRSRPDVVLVHKNANKYAIAECKKSSFGPGSSTAHQARTLLLISGPRAYEVLGVNRSQVAAVLLCYFAPDTAKKALTGTLGDLRQEIVDLGLPAGECSVIGMKIADEHLGISVDDAASALFELHAGFHPFLSLDPGTDPRPLYFIPFDPDVEQSPNEKLLCKRILFERIHGAILSAVGRANAPVTLLIQPSEILNDAMFGMSRHWENQAALRHMRRLCRQFIEGLATCLNAVTPETLAYRQPEGWRLTVTDVAHHEALMNRLTRFSSEELDLRTDPKPGLFDDFE